MDPEVVTQLMGATRRTDSLSVLTAREREVLSLMAEGRSNAAIAHALVVSEGAVEKHVANIFAKANNTNASIITAAELNQILAYPNLILYPYDGSTARVVVSQLLVTTSNEASSYSRRNRSTSSVPNSFSAIAS